MGNRFNLLLVFLLLTLLLKSCNFAYGYLKNLEMKGNPIS